VSVLASPGYQRLHEPPRLGQHDLGNPPQLEGQARVEYVARGQPVVNPPASRAGGGGQHVDERGDVVVGDPLALGDLVDREGRAANRIELLGCWPFDLLARRHLDLAHGLEPSAIGPYGIKLGTRIARNHAFTGSSAAGWRRRHASSPPTTSAKSSPVPCP